MELSTDPGYQNLLGRISQTYNEGRLRAYQSVNAHMTETYWKIGQTLWNTSRVAKPRQITAKPCSPASAVT